MAFLPETSTWETGVYQFEITDPLQGGASGIDNVPTKQLANRTLKIYNTLKSRGIFIDLSEQEFVGQPVIEDTTFEGTVSDGDIVYWNTSNAQFEKALADGSIKQYAVGVADVTNDKVICSGLFDTTRTDTPGDPLYLSDTTPGAITISSTDIAIGQFLHDGIIYLAPAAAATAAAASIAPGSITPAMLQESYHTKTYLDPKIVNWDIAYTDRLKWDGGATGLNPSTGRTSLGLTGDVTTHNHNTAYHTKTYLDPKIVNWDTAYTDRLKWDGGATGLNAATGRTSLGLTGDVTTHNHNTAYYTKTLIDSKINAGFTKAQNTIPISSSGSYQNIATIDLGSPSSGALGQVTGSIRVPSIPGGVTTTFFRILKISGTGSCYIGLDNSGLNDAAYQSIRHDATTGDYGLTFTAPLYCDGSGTITIALQFEASGFGYTLAAYYAQLNFIWLKV